MELTKEMAECINTRLYMQGRCSDCPKVEVVERRKEDNRCLISIKCKEWIDKQEKKYSPHELTEEEELSLGIC